MAYDGRALGFDAHVPQVLEEFHQPLAGGAEKEEAALCCRDAQGEGL
jgi:hypothetical protein